MSETHLNAYKEVVAEKLVEARKSLGEVEDSFNALLSKLDTDASSAPIAESPKEEVVEEESVPQDESDSEDEDSSKSE